MSFGGVNAKNNGLHVGHDLGDALLEGENAYPLRSILFSQWSSRLSYFKLIFWLMLKESSWDFVNHDWLTGRMSNFLDMF